MTKIQEYMRSLFPALKKKDYEKVDILLARISNLRLTPDDFARIERLVEDTEVECTGLTS